MFSAEQNQKVCCFDRLRHWITDSYDYWSQLLRTDDAERAGVRAVNVYAYSSTKESIVRVSIQISGSAVSRGSRIVRIEFGVDELIENFSK